MFDGDDGGIAMIATLWWLFGFGVVMMVNCESMMVVVIDDSEM